MRETGLASLLCSSSPKCIARLRHHQYHHYENEEDDDGDHDDDDNDDDNHDDDNDDLRHSMLSKASPFILQ